MKQDDIKNKTFEVAILQRGIDVDTLCFKLYNKELGEFVMDNCHYDTDPSFFPNDTFCIIGNVEIKINEGNTSFMAVLVINRHDINHGAVTLKC